MSKLLLIDGNAIIHRAYHAYPPLTTSKGELVNAVYGFLSILLTVFNKLRPEYAACAFDLAKPTFRHKEYKGYKAHRPKMDQELVDQIKRVYQVVKILNIPIFAVEGFEADDVIGTLVKKTISSPQVKLEITIVTGDQDIFQLLADNVRVFLPPRGKKPGKIYDQKEFIKKYGFQPQQLIAFKALAGDPSDEIPGVKGIGFKTAQKLIAEFGSLNKIYGSLAKIKKQKKGQRIVKLLKKDKDKAFLSQKLARIVTNVPLKFKLPKCRLLDYDKNRARAVLEALEFKSLIKKLPGEEENRRLKAAVPVLGKQENKDKQMEFFLN